MALRILLLFSIETITENKTTNPPIITTELMALWIDADKMEPKLLKVKLFDGVEALEGTILFLP